MKKILITGANGQLGKCIQKIAPQYEFECIFKDSSELDITSIDAIQAVFGAVKPDFCINAAAYTAVDLAETHQEKAFAVNAFGVENIAEICQQFGVWLIHISTDYVFDGETQSPYKEEDFTNPLGVYGASKLKGEMLAMEKNPDKTLVIRTSWLYSEFNKNFVKTMLHLFGTRKELGIVADQFGQPTYAIDLAKAIFTIIEAKKKYSGIYHFSNYPETSWYEFAKRIAALSNADVYLNPITTEQYPTPAKRPKRSTFCLDKIEKEFSIELKHWENSLEDCLKNLL